MNKTALLIVASLAAQMAFAQSKTAVTARTTETAVRENKAKDMANQGASTGVKILDQARINSTLTVAANKLGITNSGLRTMLEQNGALEEVILDAAALKAKANKTQAEKDYLGGLEVILEVYGQNAPTSLTENQKVVILAAKKIISEISGKFDEYGSPSQMALLVKEIGANTDKGAKLDVATVEAVKKVYGKTTEAEVYEFLREIIRCKV